MCVCVCVCVCVCSHWGQCLIWITASNAVGIQIPRQQYLIYLKWCQHTPVKKQATSNEGINLFWQVIDYMEIWTFLLNKGIYSKLWQCWYYCIDAPHGRYRSIWRKSLKGTTQKFYVLYRIDSESSLDGLAGADG